MDLDLPRSLAELLDRAVAAFPTETSLIDGDTHWTFSDLADEVTQRVHFTNSLVSPGDRVAIISENCPEMVSQFYAGSKAQVTSVMINARLLPTEQLELLARSRATLWLGDDASITALRPLALEGVTLATWAEAKSPTSEPKPPFGQPFIPAWLLYTSGTTGKAKGVPLSDANLIAAAANAGIARQFGAEEVLGLPFPLFHIAATNLLMAHLHGRPVVLIKGFEPDVVSRLVATHRITALSLAPTMIRRLVDFQQSSPTDLSALKTIYYGAAPITPSLLSEASQVLGCSFSQGYGMTEAAGNAVFLDGEAHAKGLHVDSSLLSKAGVAGTLTTLRVVDEQGLDVPPGELGEITLAGPQVFSGYEEEEGVSEATVDAFGGFRTGDLGTVTTDGLLQVVDRKKDIIITGGENVSSLEVESALSGHPMVKAVAVVSRPHPEWGEEIVAVVVPGDPFEEIEVRAFARQRLSGFKRPKIYVIVDQLSVNASGKVDKKELRRLVSPPL